MFDPAPRSAAVPLVSCQTLGWYHSLFGGEAHAGEALAYIRRCGFDAIDYHFEGVYTANQIRNGVTSPSDRTTGVDGRFAEIGSIYRSVYPNPHHPE